MTPAPASVARRSFLAGGSAALLAGCVGRLEPLQVQAAGPLLPPINFDHHHLMRTVACLRPFRPAGPRLEVESFGEKTVVHNYGHGGSGWSLSWGCALEAATLARSGAANEFAVIGAGVIGMTTALTLAETGARVTIYAMEFPPETRSARATGVWSPSSRIGLGNAVAAGFEDRWESWARAAHPIHQRMIGTTADPVEYITQYNLSGTLAPRTRATRDFLHLDRRIRGLNPPWRDLEMADSPFPGREGSYGPIMVFNIAAYSERISEQFLLRGGKMVRRAFASREEVLTLPEPVIVSCMGYGAKTIWGDPDVIAVRGQIGMLIPQPEARYAILCDGVNAVSRRDGVVVQYIGQNDDWGYNDDRELVDPDETTRALATMRALYQP